jgi:FkbM family methyltransferase
MSNFELIPKIVHQTWRNLELPKYVDKCVDSIRKINPNWRHCFYTDSDMEVVIEELSNAPGTFDRPTPEEFRSIPAGIEKSDVFRNAVLYLRGGIYCDIDIEAVQSFDSLLNAAELLGLPEYTEVLLTLDHPIHCHRIYGRDVLMNHFMIASPKAYLFECYFDQLSPLIRSGALGGDPVLSTGPISLTNLVDEIGGLVAARAALIPSQWVNALPDMALSFPECPTYDHMIRSRSWKRILNPFVAHYWWHNYCDSKNIFDIYGELIFGNEEMGDVAGKNSGLDYFEIWRLLSPYYHASQKRYGPNWDAGYVVADDVLAASSVVYCYGVGSMPHESEFEVTMARLGKMVHLYDGTIDRPAHDHENFRFKRENAESGRLLDHLTENCHRGRSDLMLKMDIEGAEYEVLMGCDNQVFDHFSQIVLEVHDLHGYLRSFQDGGVRQDPSGLRQILLLQRLLERYRLVHIHANNHGAFRCELPDVVELSLVRKDMVVEPNITSVYPCPRENLDFPNNPSLPEIRMDWWTRLGEGKSNTPGECQSGSKPVISMVSLRIPTIIHQSWKSAAIPHDVYPLAWQDSWRELHPGWEYRFWTDNDNRELVRCHYPQFLQFYESLDMGIKRADFCRFLYLHRFGGLYVDLDFAALRDQAPLLKGAAIVVGTLSPSNHYYRIPNAYMASVPGNGFWLQLANDAFHAPSHEQKVETLSGPFRLQWGLEKYKPPGLRILEQNRVYPIDWINFTQWENGRHYREDLVALARDMKGLTIQQIRDRLPESFAVTTWNHNWYFWPFKEFLMDGE